jgi:hypothetical protein
MFLLTVAGQHTVLLAIGLNGQAQPRFNSSPAAVQMGFLKMVLVKTG